MVKCSSTTTTQTETEAQNNSVCVNRFSLYCTFLLIIKHVTVKKTQLYPLLSGFQQAIKYFFCCFGIAIYDFVSRVDVVSRPNKT